MKNYNELEALVISWAEQKGILKNATPIAQCDKTFEEVEELAEALEAQRMGLKNFKNKKENNVLTAEEIKDALGDILVTIIIQSEMQGLSLIDCLESAYNVISKRTGVMRNGQFCKDI
jgi:NTP pyrophosphatase (non-canonical NTP hydrolase)